MRVCTLTTCYPRWHGDASGPFVESLVHKLIADFGCAVTVVAPHAPGTPDVERHGPLEIHRFHYAWPIGMEQLCYNGGIPTSLHLHPWTFSLVPGLLGSFLRKAAECMASCDVVHCHWMISGFVGLLARCANSRPVVVTTHGSDVSLARTFWPFRALNRHVIGRASVVTTVGSLQRQDLIQLGAAPQKVKHVPLGVDDEFLASPICRDKTVDVLFVGRLTPEKRPELFVAALADLARRGVKLTAQIAGDGPFRGRIEEMLHRENLSDVRMLGALPHKQVLQAMDQARCLVLVSSREGVPTVVTEAMARGLGVLACNVGSICDVITDNRTGWLMPADASPTQVASRIEQLFSAPAHLQAVGEAASRFIRENYTWHNSAQRFYNLYRTVVRGYKSFNGRQTD